MSWIRGSRARSAFKETIQPPIRTVACAAAPPHDAKPSHKLHSSRAAVEGEQPLSIYLHLPFCKRKCFYCDFPVHAVGTKPLENSRRLGIIRDYIDLLISEIGSTLVCNQDPLKTVFFGGGTPSLTPPTEVERILEAVDHRFGIASDVEISLEADPGTFDVRRLREYISLGVTRFSMGVQAFDDELLKTSGRSHDLADVRAAVRAMHAAGPSSWSLDLISGLPGLTVRSWENSLREAISASPDHVSIYDLQVEDGTPFSRWMDQGRLELPQEDSATEMYRMASQLLREEGGFEHYEISNYALPGHRCRHNMAYWTLQPFYAMGVGAASFVDGVRISRPRTMGGYRRWVEENCGHADTACSGGSARPAAGQLPAVPLEQESAEDRLLNEVMLRLRLKDGLSVVGLRQRYGRAASEKVVEALGSWRARGLVLEASDGLCLADPDGWLVSNSILSDVFLAVMDTGDK